MSSKRRKTWHSARADGTPITEHFPVLKRDRSGHSPDRASRALPANTGDVPPRPAPASAAPSGSDPVLIDLTELHPEVSNEIAEAGARRAAAGPTSRLWQRHPLPLRSFLEEQAATHGRENLQRAFMALMAAMGMETHWDFKAWEEDAGVTTFAKAAKWTWRRLFGIGSPRRKVKQGDVNSFLALVDRVWKRWLDPGAEADEAKERIVEAFLAGEKEEETTTPEQAESLIQRIPRTMEAASRRVHLTQPALNQLRWMQTLGAENVKQWSIGSRFQLRQHLVRAVMQQTSADKLARELFDRFGQLNRDWRRLAITEINESATQGFVAGQPLGTRLQRYEAIDACTFCKSIDGNIVTVVDPTKEPKDGDTEVWVGKTNVGRARSARKRTSTGKLVMRTADELWWIAAGVQHPHCRGGWEKVT